MQAYTVFEVIDHDALLLLVVMMVMVMMVIFDFGNAVIAHYI